MTLSHLLATSALLAVPALLFASACGGSIAASADGGTETVGSSVWDSGTDEGRDAAGLPASQDGALVMPRSCLPGGAGMSNCGPGGSGDESCCTSLEVMGGKYYRTYTNYGSGPMGEADPASVSGFRLDKYLVTVGRFRQFVAAWNNGSGWLPSAGSGKHTHLNGGQGLANSGRPGTYEPGWVASDDDKIAPTDANLACGTWTSTAGSQENLPIACVTRLEAYAFCIWDGGFLPSEAEWEYAAAGGGRQLEYPWGSTDPGTENQYAIYNFYNSPGEALAAAAPVGSATLGVGPWGQLDMAGDLFEYNLDWYAAYVDPCTDCAYLTAASSQVVRGGGFQSVMSYLLAASRTQFIGGPTAREYDIGFRCARTP